MLVKHFVQIGICSTVLQLIMLNQGDIAGIDFNVNTDFNPLEAPGRQNP